MDEHKLVRDQEAAARAKGVIEAPGFLEAVDLIRSELIERWEGTEDPTVRDELWRSLQVLKQIPITLKKAMARGRLAKSDIDRLQGHSGQLRAV